MARFDPFPAIRYDLERNDLGRVLAPPYDVIDASQRAELAGRDEHNAVRIDLPDEAEGDGRYATARDLLQAWLADGTLVVDPGPPFPVYRMTTPDEAGVERRTTGVLGALELSPPGTDILPHEHTTKKAKSDRLDLLRSTRSNLSAIWGLSLAKGLTDLLPVDDAPLADVVDEDGVRHTVWRIAEPGPFLDAFRSVPHAYVADGHHRSASAWRAGRELRRAPAQHRGDGEYNWFLAVLFPAEQLRILPYNRLVRDLGGLEPPEVLARLAQVGQVSVTGEPSPPRPAAFGVFLMNCWYRLELDERTIDRSDPIRSLDVSLLQDRVLAPILGVGDPRTDTRIDFVGGIRGTAELERRVRSGGMAIAFALYPTTVEQLMAVADAGKIMPPKSTWFEPKLRSGLFVHTL